MNVIVTSFGVVRLGPEFSAYLSEIIKDKRKKAAKKRLERFEEAVNVLAEIRWMSGEVLEKLP